MPNSAVQALWALRWGAQRTLENSLQYASTHAAIDLPAEPEEIIVISGYNEIACNALVADILEADIISIDSEWRPDWCDESDNPVAVLQLAFPFSRRAYLLQLSQLGQLPQEVQSMLQSTAVLKVGFAIDYKDRWKLERSGIRLGGPTLDMQTVCEMLLDPSGLAVHPRSLGLASAVAKMLGECMPKDKRISCSDWARRVLTGDQIFYAAMDAWVTLRLFGAIVHRVLVTGSVSKCLGAGACQAVDIAHSTLAQGTHARFEAESLIIKSRSEKAQQDAASTISPAGSPAPSSRGSFTSDSSEGGAEVQPPIRNEHSPAGGSSGRRRRHGNAVPGRNCREDDEDSLDRAGSIPSTILTLCFRDLHTHRWHKLAMSYVLSFLLFPPGLPCVVLLPLHLLLMQTLHACKVLPTLPSSVLSAYLVGSLTRLLVGVCAHGYRHWLA
mmetsp:Transcript_34172/g.77970  ORF Transcript_34172/g.77970 Transcript_34172/m.77970 type:complete len:441 (-) Transcript_34172:81-1403(-)